jgi:hypothetical protein
VETTAGVTQQPQTGVVAVPVFSTENAKRSLVSYSSGVGWQLLGGLIYYLLIVRHYPVLSRDATPSDEAKDLQKKNELIGMMDASCTNIVLSFCCPASRAAQTIHAANVCNFWPACILMSLMPCLSLCYFTTMTPLQARLGGREKGCVRGCLCSWCCSCCVIAHDAHTLDVITGVPTKICGTGA